MNLDSLLVITKPPFSSLIFFMYILYLYLVQRGLSILYELVSLQLNARPDDATALLFQTNYL